MRFMLLLITRGVLISKLLFSFPRILHNTSWTFNHKQKLFIHAMSHPLIRNNSFVYKMLICAAIQVKCKQTYICKTYLLSWFCFKNELQSPSLKSQLGLSILTLHFKSILWMTIFHVLELHCDLEENTSFKFCCKLIWSSFIIKFYVTV